MVRIPGPHLDLPHQESQESESRKGPFKPASLEDVSATQVDKLLFMTIDSTLHKAALSYLLPSYTLDISRIL